MFVKLLDNFKQILTAFVARRSAIRKRQYPDRKNLLASLALLLIALPLALGMSVVMAFRSMFYGPFMLTVVDIDSEFGHFVEVMERVRLDAKSNQSPNLIMVLSRFRFDGLADLYSTELNSKVLFGGRTLSLVQQVVLLQPRTLVKVRRFAHLPSNSWMSEVIDPIGVNAELRAFHSSTLSRLGLTKQRYVAMAVYTSDYDEKRAADQVNKQRSLVSVGADLAPVVDHLRNQNLDVVMLGSRDTGRAHVPREIFRLDDFGRLGGRHEVALAASCLYFWADGVGAHWLGVPFLKPILITNQARLQFSLGPRYMTHLNTYTTLSGRRLSIRELLDRELSQKRTSYKEASYGRIQLIKNSSREMIDVHNEMMARLTGTFIEDNEEQEIRYRLMTVYKYFGLETPMISSTFLKMYSDLI